MIHVHPRFEGVIDKRGVNVGWANGLKVTIRERVRGWQHRWTYRWRRDGKFLTDHQMWRDA